jgi:hypothetical protein
VKAIVELLAHAGVMGCILPRRLRKANAFPKPERGIK